MGGQKDLQARLYDEEKWRRAERASLYDAHRARNRYRLAVQVEDHLELCINKLNDKAR